MAPPVMPGGNPLTGGGAAQAKSKLFTTEKENLMTYNHEFAFRDFEKMFIAQNN